MARLLPLGMLLASMSAVAPTDSHGQSAQLPDDAQVRKAAVASFPEYLDFLAIPNDALAKGDGLQKNAAWLQTALKKRGFEVREVANNGRPIVLAAYPGAASKKTVLYYLHFDGQPVNPAQWSQPSPWQPVLKKKTADGKWAIVDMQQLMQTDFDPELRVFARASSDDKGPIMMFLAALDAMKAQGLTPAANVKLLLDSEEEINSGNRRGNRAKRRLPESRCASHPRRAGARQRTSHRRVRQPRPANADPDGLRPESAAS
jgi:acetylornithine deacetylase/succinyl-diaminopimelate desuccinylase-like protein